MNLTVEQVKKRIESIINQPEHKVILVQLIYDWYQNVGIKHSLPCHEFCNKLSKIRAENNFSHADMVQMVLDKIGYLEILEQEFYVNNAVNEIIILDRGMDAETFKDSDSDFLFNIVRNAVKSNIFYQFDKQFTQVFEE